MLQHYVSVDTASGALSDETLAVRPILHLMRVLLSICVYR